MASGLGLIVSGRMVQTEWTAVSDSQLLSVIPGADSINHVVVFLTGTLALPPGTVAMVYFSWPDPSAPPNWQLLGYISNAKPSAIFKVSRLKRLDELSGETAYSATFGERQICHDAQIGISIEPEQNAAACQAQLNETTESHATFAQKMLENLFNYLSSFAVTPAQLPTLPPNAALVPLDRLQTWYQNFERRLRSNPNFWKN